MLKGGKHIITKPDCNKNDATINLLKIKYFYHTNTTTTLLINIYKIIIYLKYLLVRVYKKLYKILKMCSFFLKTGI